MSPDPGASHSPFHRPNGRTPRLERMLLFVAQGFGVGARLPAPGTWGSFLGLVLFAMLAWPGDYLFYLAATLFCPLVSVPICTLAEGALGRKDPGSVVLDELTAMPLCYLGWVTDTWLAVGRCSLDDLFNRGNAWLILVLGFLAFRLFDIAKPWPIRAVQRLPGGWGVVLDDLLAAACSAVVVLLLSRAW